MNLLGADVIGAAGYDDDSLRLLDVQQGSDGKLVFKPHWYLKVCMWLDNRTGHSCSHRKVK